MLVCLVVTITGLSASHMMFIIIFLTRLRQCVFFFFFFNDTATTEIYTLSLHDALPIFPGRSGRPPRPGFCAPARPKRGTAGRCFRRSSEAAGPLRAPGRAAGRARRKAESRSEEHTSELQSRLHLVCRLLLEKKKQKHTQ